MVKELKKVVRLEVKKEIKKYVNYDDLDYWIVQDGMYFDGEQLMLKLARQDKKTYKVQVYKVVSLEPKKLEVL